MRKRRKREDEHGGPTIPLHGGDWQWAHLRDEVKQCLGRPWRRQEWRPRDAVVNRATGSMREYLGQTYDSERAELIRGGWDHDHCEICTHKIWDRGEEEDRFGYTTDGREWVCTQCYRRFLAPNAECRDLIAALQSQQEREDASRD